MDMTAYTIRIDELLRNLKPFFPRFEEYAENKSNRSMYFLTCQNEMKISFDYSKKSPYPGGLDIWVAPTVGLWNKADIQVYRRYDVENGPFDNRAGLILNDMPFAFVEKMLRNILKCIRNKGIFNFNLVASVGGWHEIPMEKLIEEGFGDEEDSGIPMEELAESSEAVLSN